MTTIQCTEIQVEKARVFPSGHHGEKCKVGDHGVRSIEYVDGAMIVSAVRKGTNGPERCRFIVRDWLHGKLAEDDEGESSDPAPTAAAPMVGKPAPRITATGSLPEAH